MGEIGKSVKAMVKMILQRAPEFSWEAAANRLVLTLEPGGAVINIFDRRYRHPETSEIHSHSVDFRSDIVAGVMRQWRYTRTRAADEGSATHWCQEVKLAGELKGAPFACCLTNNPVEIYQAGDSYEITAPEFHWVEPDDGTVTLITRQYKTSPESTFTFWPYQGALTVDRTPIGKFPQRQAAEDVVRAVTCGALEKWF